MSTQQATCMCYRCGRPVPFHYEKINHRQQLFLTLFTLGLWLPIWLFDIIARTKICDVCGKPAKRDED